MDEQGEGGRRISSRDVSFMERALELAERGRGRVEPNPMVGAVAVSEGEIVGEGWHAEFGGEHAEVRALRDAGDAVRAGTLYVSLEPCDHTGKTPPCTEAVLEAGISRVVVACRDPGPDAGGGVERLRREGVEVRVGILGDAAARLNAPFFWERKTGRPFVVLKLALSLDGRIAAAPGERTELTGEEAWEFVHRLRAGHDGVMVGRETVEVDDPRLTARGEVEPRRPPVRLVMDTRLRLPPDARLVRSAGDVPTWLVCAPDPPAERRRRLEQAGVRVLSSPPGPSGVDPGGALERLHAEDVRSVLLEGGARVAASFLQAGTIQRMHLIYAPVLLGGSGVDAFAGAGSTLPDWRPTDRRALGRDTLITLESGELRRVLSDLD